MPFEGEKFEEIPRPEEEEEEIEEKPEKMEVVGEKEKGLEEIAGIYHEYWEVEREQQKKREEYRERYHEIPYGEKGKIEEEIEQMKEPIKKMVECFEQVDEEAVNKILWELNTRKFELIGRIETNKKRLEKAKTSDEMATLRVAIDGHEREKKDLEDILEAYDEGETSPLKNYIEGALEAKFHKKWNGEEGAEDLHRALLLKKAFNTLERK